MCHGSWTTLINGSDIHGKKFECLQRKYLYFYLLVREQQANSRTADATCVIRLFGVGMTLNWLDLLSPTQTDCLTTTKGRER